MGHFGGVDHGLAGDAAPVEARPAQLAGFDQHGLAVADGPATHGEVAIIPAPITIVFTWLVTSLLSEFAGRLSEDEVRAIIEYLKYAVGRTGTHLPVADHMAGSATG